MITDTELKWIKMAMAAEMSPVQMAKTYRVISQIFQKASERIELDLVDKVEDWLYNTNTETLRSDNDYTDTDRRTSKFP